MVKSTDTSPAQISNENLVSYPKLVHRKDEIQKLQDSHRAALNLMEDAVESKHSMEELYTELRESEERYRNLFNSMDEGYCIIEMIFDKHEKPVDYRFLEVNPAFEKQSGMRDVTGKRMLELVSDMEEYWLTNYGNVAVTGEPIRFANECKTLGRWFDVYAFRVDNLDDRRVAVLLTDITEKHLAEEALQNEKHRAEAANKAKSEFLANMSHEIRTPMNAVLGLSNILAMTKDLPEKQQEMVSTLQLSAQSLLGLINDLLDMSKIETNNIDLEHIPFTFGDILSEVFSVFSMKVQEENISLNRVSSFSDDQRFMGDPLRIRQVLVNLVGNALKFTNHGGVTISLTTSPNEEPGYVYVHIAVSDTGIGIAPGKLERIFDKFIQADTSTTRKFGGTGLGLAISRNLAEIMGGSITVKSDQGKGSEFTIHLPLELANETSTAPVIAEAKLKEAPAFPPMRGSVLLAEDYKANVLVATHNLQSLGYSCDVASNGKEALEKIRSGRDKYIAVLMDVQMPDMDGLEVTKIIREEEKEKGLPHFTIIAMTAHAMRGDRERCLQAGMDDYISKPFEPEELKAAFDRLS